MNPVAPISSIFFPRSASRTESGAVAVARIEVDDRDVSSGAARSAGLTASSSSLRVFFEAEIAHQLVARGFGRRAGAGEAWRMAPRGRITGSSSRPVAMPFAEIEAIGNDSLHAQVIGQRAHDVVEPLADQNDFAACGDRLFQLGDAFLLQARLQKVFEEFFAQEIEAVAADSAKDGVKQASGEDAVGDVEEGPGDGESAHRAAARPALQEALRVPGEEADGADGGQIQQASFDAPENRVARGGGRSLRRPG